ncbi:MAG: response regulator [Patescibacteria group bacterium]
MADLKRVLVAEDDMFLNKVYALALQKEGFEVEFVKDGTETLTAIARQKPTLLLLDLVMPVMDGFAVLEKLRANPETKELKIIVLSNLGQDDDMKAIEQYHVLDYVIKSNTHINEIVEKIKKVLSA